MSRTLLRVAFIACLGVHLALPNPAPAEEPKPGGSRAVLPPPPPPPRAEEELVEKVRRAIDDGVRFLKNQQSKKEGNWESVVLRLVEMEGGVTALATLALLNCGLKVDDPAVRKALDYLETIQPNKTYVVGLQTMVFTETRLKKYQPLIQRNADWLISHGIGWRVDQQMRVTGGQLKGWSYPGQDLADNSNTQYALLGLFAAKTAGAKIDDSVWKAILDYYSRTQQAAGATMGSWGYYNDRAFGAGGDRASFSMTVAGVCGLLIAAMGLDQSEQQLDVATGVAANCGAYSENAALHKGMNWIGAQFNFESDKSSFYNIYGIERLGRLSGQRFIDKYDWYRDGCDKLVRMQESGGANAGAIVGKGGGLDGSSIISTSFALLFLSKGRTPVLISKFAWGDFQNTGRGTFVEVPTGPKGQVNWNRKHNDTRHIVEFCSKELFNDAPLSWQVYDARRRDFSNDAGAGGKTGKEKILEEVGTLLQSPVLYINGHGPLGGRGGLTEAQKKIVKTYLEEGGFILAEACCGDKEFNESFKALMKELFPDNNFRKMAPEHAIWSMFPGITPKDFPEIEVMERGCRTVCVFSPVPLAGYWEEAKYMPADGKNPANRGEKAYCFARNVIAYATGMELPKPKLTRTTIVAKGSEASATRSHFKAAQLRLEGEQAPAPDALKNLMGYLRDNARLEVALNSVILPPYDEQLSTFKFNYIHGRKPLNFSPQEIENLQSNLNTGGLLFADAACNGFEQWKAFDKSFRDMCAKLYPDKPLVQIPVRGTDGKEDPLFKLARETLINIRTVKCRRETPDGKGPEKEMHEYPVVLEGIKHDGRWVVIYSKYDVGCAIEGHKAADCLGHDKDSALRIASAVVLYSLKR
jgi:hypothetical protein